jgi:hypothetical protein
VLSTVPRKNAFWAALTSFVPDLRYPLFWQGLESLFGPENDRSKATNRLRQRISIFLADNQNDRDHLSDMVNAGYDLRSKIVHGRWDEGADFRTRMAGTEAIVRTVVRHIIERPGMLGVFTSTKRDAFLEAWVNSKSFSPPPFP